MKPIQQDLLIDETSDGDVGAALGLLRGALYEEELRIRTEGAQAMATGDYATAGSVIDWQTIALAKHCSMGSKHHG